MKKAILTLLLGLFLLACAGASLSRVSLDSMTDPRDGQTYRTVKIGSQTWMAQNLNYKTDSSYCYKDDTSNCTKYGRLYNFAVAVGKPESECGKDKACRLPPEDIQGVCPTGWHLPSMAEWDSLFAVVGGRSDAGRVLKSSWGWKKHWEPVFQDRFTVLGKILDAIIFARPIRSLSGWLSSGNGSDTYSFSVLPTGCRHAWSMDVDYIDEGKETRFWTSSISGCGPMAPVSFYHEDTKVGGGGSLIFYDCTANPVRCVKDDVSKVEKPVERVEVSVDSMTDLRDGQTYKTVKIGSQTWMARNLNYEMDYSYCYGDDSTNCAKFGRLYGWDAANSACPEGWYLPSKAEWDTLFAAVGGDSTAGRVLKSTSGWDACGDGTDAVSFSALPAGEMSVAREWIFKGSDAYFWSSTESDSMHAYNAQLNNRFEYVMKDDGSKYQNFSVRCLKGNSIAQSSKSVDSAYSDLPSDDFGVKGEKGFMTDTRDGQTYKTVQIGEQTWMAENLNFETADSYCYKDSTNYCTMYGRLYTWAAATTACPEGWHLPSDDEWNTLLGEVGKKLSIGAALRSTSGWGENTKSLDAFGFSVLPAGYRYIFHVERHIGGGRFEIVGSTPKYSGGGVTFFWGTAENNDAFRVYMNWYRESADFSSDKENAYSVRCVKD